MPNTKDHYNVMLTKKLISFQDLEYPGLRRPQTFRKSLTNFIT